MRAFNELVFTDDCKMSLTDFKERYKNHFVFKKIAQGKPREKALKDAHRIATKGNL